MSAVKDLGLPPLPANQFWRIGERFVELCERVPQGEWESVPVTTRTTIYGLATQHYHKNMRSIKGQSVTVEHRCNPVEVVRETGKKDWAMRPVQRIVQELRCEERVGAYSFVLASEPEGRTLVSKANVARRCGLLLAEMAAEKEAAELVGEYPPQTKEVSA